MVRCPLAESDENVDFPESARVNATDACKTKFSAIHFRELWYFIDQVDMLIKQ